VSDADPQSEPRVAGPNAALDELRATLDRARDLIRELEQRRRALTEPDNESADDRAARLAQLEAELRSAELDRSELANRLVEAERQAGQLMSLYVATYQLHATLDPAEVQSTIAEIAVDLLGAASFVLLLRRDESEAYEVALARRLPPPLDQLCADGSYRGGEPMLDATLRDGVLRLGPTESSRCIAAVPLTVQEQVVGVLAVLELLPHKPALEAADRDILDLLAAHAASALFAARVYAQTDRKLRTLESLVKLMRGA
jgi:hypothetical protein